jgi:preprotein translocase subunit Sec61beta
MKIEMEEIDKPVIPDWVFFVGWLVAIVILAVDFVLFLVP